jgi:hypothetical protein
VSCWLPLPRQSSAKLHFLGRVNKNVTEGHELWPGHLEVAGLQCAICAIQDVMTEQKVVKCDVCGGSGQ